VVPVPAIGRGHARGSAKTSQRDLGGTETILVVEDDQAVRDLTRRVLAIYGYRVVDAGTPDEALERAAGAGRIDLLLTDMVLPEMSGVALADTLVRRHPGLRVVFMSGYTDAEPTRPAPELSPGALLEKPFIPQVLVGRVREALDAEVP
jgi:CheY-like chemotaxis protein